MIVTNPAAYFRGDTDWRENGSLKITRHTKDTYRITGVYHYMDRLFVIDGLVKSGEPLLLFESAGAKCWAEKNELTLN